MTPLSSPRLPRSGLAPRTTLRQILSALALLVVSTPAHAHVGSKDVFEQVQAGPYKLFVTIRTPLVIPGVATVEVRSSGAPVNSLAITPVPLTGEAAKHPPTADQMQVSADDPAFFTGSLWLMAAGSWQVRLQVEGAAGAAVAAVPVAAAPLTILPMQRSLGVLLAILGLILAIGMAGIVAAAVGEARLPPGSEPSPARRRRALIASVVTLVVMGAAVFLGDKWWKVEAAGYAADLYHPSDLHARLNGNALSVTFGDYNEKKHKWEPFDREDWLLDHGHLMHLYAIRWPAMDAAYHLHPAPDGEHTLRMTLPAMPAGEYRLYADVVYKTGFPETLTSSLTVPAGLPPTPLAAEDASATPAALARGELGPACTLPDGYTMVWERPAEIRANAGYSFRFHLLNAAGRPAADMQPYLGMAGHAAFVKTDGTVFAHTHPEGSAAMPALMLAEASLGAASADAASPSASDMAAIEGAPPAPPISSTIEFPYGFPSPGRYRIFIQMKHGGTVETGVFDADVL